MTVNPFKPTLETARPKQRTGDWYAALFAFAFTSGLIQAVFWKCGLKFPYACMSPVTLSSVLAVAFYSIKH